MKTVLFTLAFSLIFTSAYSGEKKKDDKIFTRKITDTQKKLKIRKGDLTDTSKLLKMGSGDITDTKAMLRKTDFPNQEQLKMLKRIMAAKLGGTSNYKIAAKKSPKHINLGIKYIWDIYRVDQDIEDMNSSLAVKNISQSRKEFLNEKKKKLYDSKSKLNKNVDKINSYLEKLIESESIVSTGDFFDNEVENEKGVVLIDKLGEAKFRLKAGEKIRTKLNLKDNSFYTIEYQGETLFAKRIFFKLK
ncbi:MAG: hypothetical protein NE327_08370 [Lentisphaeraceae bacterium]|nr:hypothetical protein [Lentisphaeraceae bacterium]